VLEEKKLRIWQLRLEDLNAAAVKKDKSFSDIQMGRSWSNL
jgi:hypothetical protein